MVQSRSLSLSIVLHTLLVLFAAFGLPVLLPTPSDPVPLVMSVELLPISEVSNVKPSDQPIQKEQVAKAPAVKTPPKPPAPTPVKQTTAPPPSADKTPFDPMDDADDADAVKKKPADKPRADPKDKSNDDFKKLLDTLKADAQKNDAPPVKPAPAKVGKDATTTPENKTKSDAPYNDAIPMSMSEKDSIRSQFIPCWTMPAGAKDAASLATKVKVELQADGTVLKASLAAGQESRYNSDPYFRAAADSAIRAVYKCKQIKNLPPEKYNSWREMELNFDPSQAL